MMVGWICLSAMRKPPRIAAEAAQGWLAMSERSPPGIPAILYLGNRNGSFCNVASAAGVAASAWVKGVTRSDFDQEGWPDLYLSILKGPDKLFRNRGGDQSGGLVFEEVTQQAGVAEPINCFPCWFWDYDNDGWEDLLVAGYQLDGTEAVVASYLGTVSGI